MIAYWICSHFFKTISLTLTHYDRDDISYEKDIYMFFTYWNCTKLAHCNITCRLRDTYINKCIYMKFCNRNEF